jgi:hypothetical protein
MKQSHTEKLERKKNELNKTQRTTGAALFLE